MGTGFIICNNKVKNVPVFEQARVNSDEIYEIQNGTKVLLTGGEYSYCGFSLLEIMEPINGWVFKSVVKLE